MLLPSDDLLAVWKDTIIFPVLSSVGLFYEQLWKEFPIFRGNVDEK